MNRKEFNEIINRTDELATTYLDRIMDNFVNESEDERVIALAQMLQWLDAIQDFLQQVNEREPIFEGPITIDEAIGAIEMGLLSIYEETLEE